MRKLGTWFFVIWTAFHVTITTADTGDNAGGVQLPFETAKILNAAMPVALRYIPREFERDYSVGIHFGNDEVIVTFGAPHPDDGQVHRGSPPDKPGFSVHLERSTLQIIKTVVAR
jgi:hypothetical protein